MKINFAEFALPRIGVAIVVGVWEDRVLTASAQHSTRRPAARSAGRSPRHRASTARRTSCAADRAADLPLSRIVVAGLGKPDAVDARLLQDLGGNLVAHLNGAGESEATFAIDLGDGAPAMKPAEAAAQLAFGAALRAYRFDKYRTTQKPEQEPSLTAITVASRHAGARRREAHRALGAAAEAVAFTRDLVSEPANTLYPETLAERAASLAALGLSVEVLDENRMRELGMGALLGVAQGSVRPPRSGRHGASRRTRRAPRRSPLSARASRSTPAASRSSRPPAWAT